MPEQHRERLSRRVMAALLAAVLALAVLVVTALLTHHDATGLIGVDDPPARPIAPRVPAAPEGHDALGPADPTGHR